MSEIALADLKLAVTEVCGNVQHAYEDDTGVVRLVFEVEPEAIEVSVEDEGAGRRLPRPRRRLSLREGLAESGMGLAIVRAVMDEVAIDEDPARAAPSCACARAWRPRPPPQGLAKQ